MIQTASQIFRPSIPCTLLSAFRPGIAGQSVHELAIWLTPNLVLPRREAPVCFATRHPPCRAFTNWQFGLAPNLVLPRREALACLPTRHPPCRAFTNWQFGLAPNLALPRREGVARLATRHPPCRAFTNWQFGGRQILFCHGAKRLPVFRPGIRRVVRSRTGNLADAKSCSATERSGRDRNVEKPLSIRVCGHSGFPKALISDSSFQKGVCNGRKAICFE